MSKLRPNVVSGDSLNALRANFESCEHESHHKRPVQRAEPAHSTTHAPPIIRTSSLALCPRSQRIHPEILVCAAMPALV